MRHLAPNVHSLIFLLLSSSFETMARWAISKKNRKSPWKSINFCRTVFKERKAVMIKDGQESDQAPQANAGKEKDESEAPREVGRVLFQQSQAGHWGSGWCMSTTGPSDGGQHPAGVPDKTIRVPPPKHPEDWGPRWHPQGAPGLVPRFPQMGHLLLYPWAARNITIPSLVGRWFQATTVLTQEQRTLPGENKIKGTCRVKGPFRRLERGASPLPPSPLTSTISHTRWDAGSFYGRYQS